MLEDNNILALITIVVGFVALLLFLWLRNMVGDASERAVRRVRRRRIQDIEPGQRVKVVGRARQIGETLRGAMTDAPCVAYELMLEYREPHVSGSRANASKLWNETEGECETSSFVVEDDSGAVVVDVEPADFVLIGANDHYLTVGDDPSRAIELISRHADARLLKHYELRYCEWRVEDGMEVAVVGTAQRAAESDEERRMVLTATDDALIYVTDRKELFGK